MLLCGRKAGRRVDVRNASQLVGTLVPLRLVDRLEAVVRIVLAIPLRNVGASVSSIGPVSGADPALEGILLTKQVLLRRICYGHVACVDAEARLCGLRAKVVVGSPRVPKQEVTRLGAKFLPLQALVLEPLHAVLSETEPFVSPGRDLGLIFHGLVELLGDSMSALADDETAVLGSVGQKVHQALQTAETRLERILILVRPGNVLGNVCTARAFMLVTCVQTMLRL